MAAPQALRGTNLGVDQSVGAGHSWVHYSYTLPWKIATRLSPLHKSICQILHDELVMDPQDHPGQNLHLTMQTTGSDSNRQKRIAWVGGNAWYLWGPASGLAEGKFAE